MEIKMKIAWIGTGVMGASMAGHLQAAGHELTVYNRTKAKADALIADGARWADTPAEAAADADVIFMIVGYPSDVEAVALGADGILSGAKPGAIVVDCTTSSPALAQKIAEAAQVKGIAVLDAPVSGGDVGAQNAALSFMVGGDAVAFEKVKPIFELMGKTAVLQGGPGAGQHTKMVNQTLIASGMIGLCEAMLYAEKSGLDPLTVLQSVGGGAAASWGLANLWPRMINDDFEPGFFVEHFIKDMGIALDEAKRMNLELPGLELAMKLYTKTAELGYGRKGTQALLLALREMNKG
jgi:3-hydroxyisobutyrate dehydrogenase